MSSRTVVLTFTGVSSGVLFQHRGMDWGSSDNVNTLYLDDNLFSKNKTDSKWHRAAQNHP